MISMRRREAVCSLPRGWEREAVRRQDGAQAGKLEVTYYSPAGKRIKNKADLKKELGDRYDVSALDFATGKVVSSLMCKPGRPTKVNKNVASSSDSRANLNVLTPPIRQTASIFKQPVTVFKTNTTKVKKELKSEKDKPRQLFWERRLSNICPKNEADETCTTMSIPGSIRELDWLQGRGTTNTLLASLSTALHLDKKPIVGQVYGLFYLKIVWTLQGVTASFETLIMNSTV